jgi:hypothetical protein
MKFLTLRFLVAILTFALGATAFWVARQKYTFWQTEIAQQTNVKQTKIPESKPERFELLGHACGNGWVDGYEMPDGQRVSTGLDVFGSPRKAHSELSKTLSKAERILTTTEKYEKPNGEIGKRTVAEFVSKKSETNSVGIFWQKKGEDSYEYIYAPTLEIALEFEQYLESKQMKMLSK